MTFRQPIPESERHPLITPRGQQRLRWMLEHPHAPRYNFACGDRMTRAGLDRVRAFEQRLFDESPCQEGGRLPPWMVAHLRHCLESVPLHRRRATPQARAWLEAGAPETEAWDAFSSLPSSDRGDLQREPWSLVADDQPLDDLIVYDTSGTTGTSVLVMSHPEVSTSYLAQLRRALATRGVTLEGGDGVSIVHVAVQATTLTHCSVSSYLDDAGFAKVNLNPAEWRDPADRAAFLDACHPEIYTGDPLAFLELASLGLATRPRALVSSAMALLPGWAAHLEQHFGCPVLDTWSLNECRLVTCASAEGHVLLRPDVYLEILDEQGRPCPDGARGEITLSGGNNPFLVLLRYRTGDHAALVRRDGIPVLLGLEGRAPVRFVGSDGRWFNNIDVTTALRSLPLAGLTLHQSADGSLQCRVRGAAHAQAVESALAGLFGAGVPLCVASVDPTEWPGGKPLCYTSDLTPPQLPA